MARVLLILPTTTYRAAAFLDAAERLGVEVVTGSERPQALADVMGDRFLELDLEDPESAVRSIAELAGRLPLDAIVAVDDQGGLVAATAAERLGLRHNPPAAVRASHDKAAMRRLVERSGVAQPAWQAVPARAGDPDGEARDVAAAAVSVGLPAVVKPCSLAGSRGVIRVDTHADALVAARRVRAIARGAGVPPEERLLVERYIEGPEVALEGLVHSGRLEVLAIFDKPDPLEGPYFEETIYVTPSRLGVTATRSVSDAVAAALRAIGIVEGPVHAELRMAAGPAGTRRSGALPAVPVLIEVAARTIGGRCASALRFAAGASLEELVLRQALARDVPGERESLASGVMMLPIARSGRLEGVDGVDKARHVPHVTGIEITVAPGRVILALPEGDRYLGFIFARAESPELVEQALRAAHAELDVRIAPEPSSLH